MKKIILSTILVMACFIGFSQSTFEIKSTGTKYTTDQLTSAFSSADFCGSYYTSKRNIIKMDDGSIIELKSKTETTASGIDLPESCFLDDNVVFYKSIWSIGENNILMRAFDSEHSSEKEYKHYNLEEQ